MTVQLKHLFKTTALLVITFIWLACSNSDNHSEKLLEKKSEILEQVQEKPQKQIIIKIDPFHEKLWSLKKFFNKEQLEKLKKEEGNFFTLYCKKIINIGPPSDPKFEFYLTEFLKDPSVTEIYNEVLKKNKNFSSIEKELSEAFTLYNFYFPNRFIPKVKTYVSGFNYGIIATDSVLGIGLDMFLGSNHKFYKAVGIPDYLNYYMDKKYLITECVKGWIDTEFNSAEGNTNLLTEMINAGKVLYLTDIFLPEYHDSIKIKYNTRQYNWIKENEAIAWQQLIGKQTLFTTDYMEKKRFLGEAPFTKGFPRQSPPRLGQYFGWMIVRAFMEKHPDYTPAMLIKEQNAQLILNQSKFKPKKINF